MLGKQSLKTKIQRLTPAQLLLIFYMLAIVISTVLLALPVAYQEGVKVPFIDILFTAVSAISVTGLSTISVADTLSTTGVIILALILHLGAVGVMTVSTFLWLLIGKRIGLAERRLIMQDQNQTTFGGMVQMIREIVLVVFIVELIGVLILGGSFLQFTDTVKEAFLHGFF